MPWVTVGDNATIHLDTTVDGVDASADGVRLRVGDGGVDADAAIVATTSAAAGRLLHPSSATRAIRLPPPRC
ncbi:MAG: FAD-dependent oxidoreductase [Acidimicrobiales bacterium]